MLTVIVEREGNGYVALCPEVDVASQGDSVAGWVAEEWWSRGTDGRFNLEVLNMTGILSRPLREQRMRLFL